MHGRQNLVVYLGLNPNASMEAHALSVLGNHVLLIGPQKHRGHVYVGHRNFDLSQESDISAFAHSLGLPEAQAAALTAALRAAGIAGRDSLARLAQVWAHAEKTGALPARFVMSGHHVPGMFYGTRGGGVLSAEDIKSISVVFPRAAGAVDDLYFSACNTAAEIADWTPIFPNLRTAWAYLGTAPSLSTGAAAHIRLWQRSTRGNQQRIDRMVAKNTGRGKNVAVWSRFTGLQTGVLEPMENIRDRVIGAENIYQSFFRGDSVVTDHHSGPLRAYYDDIQALLLHRDVPADQRRYYDARAGVTIRLIYFDTIRAQFQATYAHEIAAGYAAVGLPGPNFSGMDRKSVLTSIAAFEAKLTQSAPFFATQLRPLLTDGLRALGGRYIPVTWM